MRLTRKLFLAFVVCLVAVLLLDAAIRVRREASYFERDMRNDARVLGHILAGECHRAFQHGGADAAHDIMATANAQDSSVRVRWVRPHEVALLGAPAEFLWAGQDAHLKRNVAGEERLLTFVPVTTRSGRMGAIELSESLAMSQLLLRVTVRDAAISAGVLLVIYAVIALVIGFVYVGRPTRELMVKLRRIGAGDLTGPLRLRQRDELAEIAGELNKMCEKLGAAQKRTQAEMESRLQATEQLRHADRLVTVGKLAAGIAHELGTPLNVVAGRAQMITSGEATEHEALECAQIVVEQARRMTLIVRQLLDFARARSTTKTRTDTKVLLGHTVDLMRTMATKRGVGLTFDPGEETELAADLEASLVQQAITNVMVNAIQATDRNGTVHVQMRLDREQSSALGSEVDCIRIDVRDDGVGMDEATVVRIFEPFFTTKPIGEGTGLGLSVSFGIIHEHHGWIAVDSALGKGTTVSIFLPIAVSAEAVA